MQQIRLANLDVAIKARPQGFHQVSAEEHLATYSMREALLGRLGNPSDAFRYASISYDHQTLILLQDQLCKTSHEELVAPFLHTGLDESRFAGGRIWGKWVDSTLEICLCASKKYGHASHQVPPEGALQIGSLIARALKSCHPISFIQLTLVKHPPKPGKEARSRHIPESFVATVQKELRQRGFPVASEIRTEILTKEDPSQSLQKAPLRLA